MANVPIRDITDTGVPSGSSYIVFDDGSMKKGLVSDLADGVRAVASQSEAQAGSDNTKTMTPLRVKDSIASEVGVSLASKAQGDLANSALQADDVAAVATSGSYNDLSDKPTIPAAGLPTGGTTGQVLAKTSGTDFAATWSDVGTGDVAGPASSADGGIPQYDGTTGKKIKDGLSLDTDGTLAANSDTKVASQKAVKAYSDAATQFTQTGTGASAVGPFSGQQNRVFTPEQFGCKGDTIEFTDTVTVSGASLTTTSHTFTSDDVGKIISIGGAGYYAARDGTVASGGSGYSGIPTVTLVGGTAIDTVSCDMTLSGDAGTDIEFYVDTGRYSAVPSNPISTTADTGSGMTLNITWEAMPHTTTIASVDGAHAVTLTDGAIVDLTSASVELRLGTDDSTNMQKAATAAAAALTGGAAVNFIARGGYTLGTGVTFSLPKTGKFNFDNHGGWFHDAIATDSAFGLWIKGPGDTSGASCDISSNATRGAKSIVVNSATAIAKGTSFSILGNSGGSNPQGQTNRAKFVYVSGSTATIVLEKALEFDLSTSNTNVIQAYVPARNATISNVTIDCFGKYGRTGSGLQVWHMDRLKCTNIDVRNLFAFNCSGFACFKAMDSKFDVGTYKGSGGVGALAIAFVYATACRLHAHQVITFGFGITVNLSSGNRVALESDAPYGRCMKFVGACGNTGWAKAANAPGTWIGVGFTQCSSHNVLSVHAYGCHIGVWGDGSGSIKNTITSLMCGGNDFDVACGSADLDWFVHFASSDHDPIIGGDTTTLTYTKGPQVWSPNYKINITSGAAIAFDKAFITASLNEPVIMADGVVSAFWLAPLGMKNDFANRPGLRVIRNSATIGMQAQVTVASAGPTGTALFLAAGSSVTDFVINQDHTISLGATTDASSTTAAGLKVAGGLAVAKKAFFGSTVVTPASATTGAGLRIVAGTAPTSPVNGDIWQDGTNLKTQIGGATKTIAFTLVFTPEQYGAIGDGTTDDTTAIAAAITAAKTASAANGSAKILFQRTYKTTDTISIASWTNTLDLEFTGSAGFHLNSSTSSKIALSIGSGSVTATTTDITANVAAGSNILTVGSTSSFAAGNYVLVYGGTGVSTYVHAQVNKIKTITSSTKMVVERVIEFPIVAATTMPTGYASGNPFVQKVTMDTGRLIMKGGVFDGTNATGASSLGVSLQYLAEPNVKSVRTSNFIAAGSTGFGAQYCYSPEVEDIFDKGSGDAVTNSSASINLLYLTNASLNNIESLNSAGFGILIDYLMGSRETNIVSTGSAGRGIKHWGCCGNIQVNLKADNNTFTGIDYDSLSLNNRGFNFSANNNGNQGLIFIGTGSVGNVISGFNGRGNSTDVAFANSFAADNNNAVLGTNDDATVSQSSGVTGVTVASIQKSWVKVHRSANVSAASGANQAIGFDTVDFDPLSQYNTSTGTFTAKRPGWYHVQIECVFTTTGSYVSASAFLSTGGTVADSMSDLGSSSLRIVYDRVVYIAFGGTIAPSIQQNSGSTLAVGTNSRMTVTQV